MSKPIPFIAFFVLKNCGFIQFCRLRGMPFGKIIRILLKEVYNVSKIIMLVICD